MSQLRAMRRGYRAASAVAAVCALIFSLLLSGAARPSYAFVERIDVACDHSAYHDGQDSAVAQRPTEARRHGAPARSGHKCPDCCLAAHAGSAVLPERVAWVTQPDAERSAEIRHSVVATPPPESFASSAANGARAPPSI